MKVRIFSLPTGASALFLFCCATLLDAQGITPVCTPQIVAKQTVASKEQRAASGNRAEPPLTDLDNGFAWPDTPLGITKTANGYAFFGSDGGLHAKQEWQGKSYGNDKYGSVVRTLGTLDNPLGTGAPLDITIDPNPDPSVNPSYPTYNYLGGGPVYRVSSTRLLMVYHAEINTQITPTEQSFYSVLGLAASSNEGASWTDLGEIVRNNQAYRDNLDGIDIGDPPLVVSPDGKYLYLYFTDWLANGTTHWKNTRTSVSVARAPMAAVIGAAFGAHPHAALFQKYYHNSWELQPGIGGYSSDLNPQAGGTQELQVAWNEAIHRYQMFTGIGVIITYSESPDGLHWSNPSLLFDFRPLPDQPNVYIAPVGEGDNPLILGKEFYIYYTSYPTTGAGWPGASVHRFTVSCQ